MTETWTAQLWDDVTGIHAAILAHPFLAGLTDGSLSPERFAYYLAQDAHYLADYGAALAAVGSKAPSHADAAMFARHAAQTADVERALHDALLPQLGVDPADLAAIPRSPTTTAYVNHLLACAHRGSFAEGLAAVLPCYWIYQRVGSELVRRGSPDPRYQAWLDTYGGVEFAETVQQVLAVADRVGADLGVEERRRAAGHFTLAARYEWMFWDAAWRQERWPLQDGPAPAGDPTAVGTPGSLR